MAPLLAESIESVVPSFVVESTSVMLAAFFASGVSGSVLCVSDMLSSSPSNHIGLMTPVARL
jgi:hypothetical protein